MLLGAAAAAARGAARLFLQAQPGHPETSCVMFNLQRVPLHTESPFLQQEGSNLELKSGPVFGGGGGIHGISARVVVLKKTMSAVRWELASLGRAKFSPERLLPSILPAPVCVGLALKLPVVGAESG